MGPIQGSYLLLFTLSGSKVHSTEHGMYVHGQTHTHTKAQQVRQNSGLKRTPVQKAQFLTRSLEDGLLVQTGAVLSLLKQNCVSLFSVSVYRNSVVNLCPNFLSPGNFLI